MTILLNDVESDRSVSLSYCYHSLRSKTPALLQCSIAIAIAINIKKQVQLVQNIFLQKEKAVIKSDQARTKVAACRERKEGTRPCPDPACLPACLPALHPFQSNPIQPNPIQF
jgi:hypothetical protein